MPTTLIDDDRSTINARIAERVHALRVSIDLTLDELAERSGVSKSMLSLVERAESSATAVVLEKIAYGLDVPLASLFELTDGNPSPVSTPADRAPWRDPQSGYVRRNISPANFPSPIQIVDVSLPAGARVAYETGARDANIHQQIWVQKGALEVTIGRDTHRLAEGDCLAMQLNAPTAFRNRTRKPVRYIVVITSDSAYARRP